MKTIELGAPDLQNAPIRGAILSQIEKFVGQEGALQSTAAIEQMESNLAALTGFRHAVGVGSGTLGLELGIRALDLPPGSEIITPALSYAATAQAILITGHVPVFADVDPTTGCLTARTVEAVLTSKARAVLAVDLLGRQVDMGPLRRLCQRQGLYLLEDGAQSLGVAPADPDLFFASFNASKPCGAWGNAGAVLTDDPEIATRIREIRNQGGLTRNQSRRVGTNGWIDGIQAIVVNHKLPLIETWTKLRRTLAMGYLRALEPWQHRRALILPPLPSSPATHNWFRFPIQVPATSLEGLRSELAKRGIQTGRVYCPPLVQQPLFKPFATRSYPGAESYAANTVLLPLYAEMTGKQVTTVIEGLELCLKPNSISYSTNP